MGEEGNDFFKKRFQPSLKQKHTQTLLDHFVPPRGFQYHPLDGDAGRNLNENIPEGMSLAYAPSRICS
jgi:hypothetical protein